MAPRKTTKPTTRKTVKTKEAPAPRQSKPVFRAGTWVAVLLLVVLGGTAIYLNQQPETAEDADLTPTAEPAFLFDAERVVNSIEVKPADGETVRVERDVENLWMVTLPIKLEADPGYVEAVASQVGSLNIVSEVEADPSALGLDAPQYVIKLTFADGTTSTLEIGDPTPTNSGYYVRVDNDKVVIVGLSGIDSLVNLAFFPPYLNTPTPTATATPPPTETPVPASDTESTPEATATP
jgi:hypothetical protein